MLFQFRYNCLVASGRLSHSNLYFGTKRQEQIYARAKLYEAEMLVNIAIITFLGIRHDTASYRSCHLTTQYVHTVSRGYYDTNS